MRYYENPPCCGCCRRESAYGDLRRAARCRGDLWDVCGVCYRECDALPGDECILRERARRAGFAA